MPDFWPFFRKKAQLEPPQRWADHLDQCAAGWAPQTLLQDMPAVVLDTETSGLRVRRDCIRLIGAIRLHYPELRTDDCFTAEFSHGTKVDGGIAVHQLLPKYGEASRAESLEELLEFIGPRIIVGHHIAFDGKMLEYALSQHFQFPVKLPNPLVDTAYLAQRLFPRHPLQRPWSLDELCDKLKVYPHERHTAGGDAFMTGLVYLKMLGRLSRESSIRLEDVLSPTRHRWGL